MNDGQGYSWGSNTQKTMHPVQRKGNIAKDKMLSGTDHKSDGNAADWTGYFFHGFQL